MKTGKSIKHFYGLVMLALAISISACGVRKEPESVPEGTEIRTKETSSGQESISQSFEDKHMAETVAVADFYYINPANRSFAFNETFLYCKKISGTGEKIETHIIQQRISDGHIVNDFVIGSKDRREAWDKVFLADKAGNCYVFWEPGNAAEESDAVYTLEKYGPDGLLLWREEYTPEALQHAGENLAQGIVTEDGRLLLYSLGNQAKIFAFSADGNLEDVYEPGLEFMEGVVAGKSGKAYAYCIARDTEAGPLLVEVGGDGTTCALQEAPLQIYSGYQEGILLRTGEGMWRYEPETGEKELLWGWEDEYVQINGNHVVRVFPGDRGFMLVCSEQPLPSSTLYRETRHIRPTATFAMVTQENRQEYPGKQTVTLSTLSKSEWLDNMVKMYNRHSREYTVEIIVEENIYTLEMQLLQGRGADLTNLDHVYAENLAGTGAFEELGPYYEASSIVAKEDILDSVREACMLQEKEVAVMPAFSLLTMQAKEVWFTPEEWDIWKFLEMAQENRVFKYQSPISILGYCMGIRYGERFIDRKEGVCHFDSPEFCQILEACGNCASYEYRNGETYFSQSFEDEDGEGDWLFLDRIEIASVWDVISEPGLFSDGDPEYFAKLVGYPGWSGGEYQLNGYGMLAINSASEHKEGAWDFLEYLLSGEYQDMVGWAFPVRKDSFEVRLNDLYDSLSNVLFLDDQGQPIDFTPTEEDFSRVRDMAASAVYDSQGGSNNRVLHIVVEEAQMYFAGDATLEDTVNKIQSRVQLYLNEQSD